jgi:hypothetical protein
MFLTSVIVAIEPLETPSKMEKPYLPQFALHISS